MNWLRSPPPTILQHDVRRLVRDLHIDKPENILVSHPSHHLHLEFQTLPQLFTQPLARDLLHRHHRPRLPARRSPHRRERPSTERRVVQHPPLADRSSSSPARARARAARRVVVPASPILAVLAPPSRRSRRPRHLTLSFARPRVPSRVLASPRRFARDSISRPVRVYPTVGDSNGTPRRRPPTRRRDRRRLASRVFARARVPSRARDASSRRASSRRRRATPSARRRRRAVARRRRRTRVILTSGCFRAAISGCLRAATTARDAPARARETPARRAKAPRRREIADPEMAARRAPRPRARRRFARATPGARRAR